MISAAEFEIDDDDYLFRRIHRKYGFDENGKVKPLNFMLRPDYDPPEIELSLVIQKKCPNLVLARNNRPHVFALCCFQARDARALLFGVCHTPSISTPHHHASLYGFFTTTKANQLIQISEVM